MGVGCVVGAGAGWVVGSTVLHQAPLRGPCAFSGASVVALALPDVARAVTLKTVISRAFMCQALYQAENYLT